MYRPLEQRCARKAKGGWLPPVYLPKRFGVHARSGTTVNGCGLTPSRVAGLEELRDLGGVAVHQLGGGEHILECLMHISQG